jgi:hypothetical protein
MKLKNEKFGLLYGALFFFSFDCHFKYFQVPFIRAMPRIKPKGFVCACGNGLLSIRVANGFTKIEKDEGPRAKEHKSQLMITTPPPPPCPQRFY